MAYVGLTHPVDLRFTKNETEWCPTKTEQEFGKAVKYEIR